MSRVQQNYEVNPALGFAGSLAEPNSPHRIEAGVLNVPSGTPDRANPRPGDALVYNATNSAWQVPTSAATSLRVAGILTYRADTVANASSILEFGDGDQIEVMTMGVIWLLAGGGITRDDLVQWDVATPFDWNVLTRPAAFANLVDLPIHSVNRQDAAAADLFKAAIGYGRVL